MLFKSLSIILDYIQNLSPQSPLESARRTAMNTAKAYEEAKVASLSANKAVNNAIQVLIENPSQENGIAVRKAQAEADEAAKKLERALAESNKAAKELSMLDTGDRSMCITGSDRIQLACFLASFIDVPYTQKELTSLALDQTGKTTIGQYGYFKRVARLAKYYGIQVSIVFPNEPEP